MARPIRGCEKIYREPQQTWRPGNAKNIQDTIERKISGNDLKTIDVLAVMLPGDPYFEDSENRRKVRYAVLSGFNAALRYMPEDHSHIHFFYLKKLSIWE